MEEDDGRDQEAATNVDIVPGTLRTCL